MFGVLCFIYSGNTKRALRKCPNLSARLRLKNVKKQSLEFSIVSLFKSFSLSLSL